MKAILLSAGQGTRLLPLTAEVPKCALRLGDRPVIQWQIDALQENGIGEIVVVLGYQARKVRSLLEERYGAHGGIRIVFNPFFEVADNLASCWMVREEMDEGFLLINGDTLFEPALVQRLLEAPPRPITLARDHKPHYDDDDMKLKLKGDRLLAIGKHLPRADGESIGMIRFRPEGARLFRETIERRMYDPDSMGLWYLAVIDQIAAERRQVWTCSVAGSSWAEIDYPLDFKHAESMVSRWSWSSAAWGENSGEAIHTGTR